MQLKKYLTLMLFAAVFWLQGAYAQSFGFKYSGVVVTEDIKVAGIAADSQLYNLPVSKKQVTKSWYDGMGRPVQVVSVQASPLLNDMVQPVVYDNLGRQVKSYLPYTGLSTDTSGSYRTNALTAQHNFYNQTSQYVVAVDTSPYVQNVFESSPLQRLLSAGSAGIGFQPVTGQHFKTVSYRPNSAALDGSIYNTGFTGAFTTPYGDSVLWVTDGKNEDNAETLLYRDRAGRTILKRQLTGNGTEPYYDTYYVYDAAGLLSYIIPPKALHLILTKGYTIATPAIVNLIYHYTYNVQGEIITRMAPGKVMTYIVYDPLYRPVLSQDTNMAKAHQWHYIKYDVKDRPIITGIYTDNTHLTQASMQTYVNGLTGYSSTWYESRTTSATNYYYTNSVFPTGSTTALSYSYYDNYDWDDNGSPNFSYKTQALPATGPEGQPIAAPVLSTDSLKGLPTMAMQQSVGPGLSSTWLMKVVFYDHYGRVIQVQSNNQLKYSTPSALTDTATTSPDFTGKPMAAIVKKVTGASSLVTTVLTTFNYDATGNRLADIDQKYNGAAAYTHIAHYNYNEIGQMVTKNLGYATSKYLQNVAYRYSIRGQLLSINNSKLSNTAGADSTSIFGMQLMYDQPDSHLTGATASYSGRVSAVKWMTRNSAGQRDNERSYVYSYDKLGRYTGSVYAERAVSDNTSNFTLNSHGFDEFGISYDENGNLLTLQRNSSALDSNAYKKVDSLTYRYDSTNPNRLDTLTDGTAAAYKTAGFINHTGSTGIYAYDADGNLVSDPYKGMTLKYNLAINRADTLAVTGQGAITYTYSAQGSVLRKMVYNSSGVLQSTTDYVDGFVFTGGTSATAVAYLPMPEGRVVNTGTALVPEYIFTDQQGNARMSFQNNAGVVKIMQENSYYAFGEQLAGSKVAMPATNPNKNLYNGGSEWQNDLSGYVDYYQTFYRNYDPATARFTASDPMAETSESLADYQYAANDPVNGNDPAGNKPIPNPPPFDINAYGQMIAYQGGEGNYMTDQFNVLGGDPEDFDPWDPIGAWAAGKAGLINTNPDAYWAAYESSGGTFGGQSIFHRSTGPDDPTTGINVFANGVGMPSIEGNVLIYNTIQFYSVNGVGQGYDIFTKSIDLGDDNQEGGPFKVRFEDWNNGDLTEIVYTPPSNSPYKKFKWIQTIDSYTSDPKNPLYPNNGVIRDHAPDAKWPFYYNRDDGYFIDTPWSDDRFTAWTTLVGVDANGHLTALGTFKWGYTNDFIWGTTERFAPQLVPIDPFTQDEINTYNSQIH